MEIQKSEYLKNEKSFLDEIKRIFHSFFQITFLQQMAYTSFNRRRFHFHYNYDKYYYFLNGEETIKAFIGYFDLFDQ